ncbi:ankyrin [Stipitochalara longipes BDJ]|nr:ankyrin [Stipitochalara longipes BDJ]
MASTDSPYILTEDNLEYYGNEDRPEIRAARNPDPRVLIALLDNAPSTSRRKYTANAFVPGHTNHILLTPLLAAIKAQLPENVRTLLSRGADPNGLPLSGLSAYAGDFLRFRDQSSLIAAPREELLKRIPTSQTDPITVAEIDERSKRICYFWSSADSVPLDHYRGGDGATALEEACKHDSTEILEMVLSSSPDVSFWTASDLQMDVPDPATPSSLSVSNPLLCAIKHGHINHLQRLLDLGFNPNSMPLACRQQSYSPAMATLMCCDPPNWDALSLLLAHPAIDHKLVTPLTKVHFLHTAVALLSISPLKRVFESGFRVSAAAPTALGHTLLHVACLPLDITHVNIFQESSYSSAHEFRQLSPSRMQYRVLFNADGPQPQPTDFFAAQAELVHYLLSQSPDPDALLAAQDCHENTALHYLAMHRTINQELLDSLLDVSEKAQDVYYDAQNRWGWTAENLVRHGEVAEVDDSKRFWVMSHAARVLESGVVVPY